MNARPQFPTKDGMMWEPSGLLWAKLCAVYGSGFAIDQCDLAEIWLEANPGRKKTYKGMPRFLNGWMARAAKQQAKRPQQVSVDKDWSAVPPEQLEAMRAKYEARGKG